MGVAYLMAMLICPAIIMFVHDYFTSRHHYLFILPFSLACITVMLLLTSHFFTDMLIGATLGCYSSYWYARKHAKHQQRRAVHFLKWAPAHAAAAGSVARPRP
jgi:hypothetical protein